MFLNSIEKWESFLHTISIGNILFQNYVTLLLFEIYFEA